MGFIFDYPQKLTNRDSWLDWLEKNPSLLTKEKALKNSPFVEQKTADKIEPKFKAGDIIRHKEQGFTCKITAVDTEYRVSDCCGTHLPFDMQDYYELVEQKPAWSEEDDRMYNIIVSYIPQHLTAESYTACINWLKSFKDRVQPQPKQELSEKDRRMLIGLIDELDAIMNKATPNEMSVYSIQIGSNPSKKDTLGSRVKSR